MNIKCFCKFSVSSINVKIHQYSFMFFLEMSVIIHQKRLRSKSKKRLKISRKDGMDSRSIVRNCWSNAHSAHSLWLLTTVCLYRAISSLGRLQTKKNVLTHTTAICLLPLTTVCLIGASLLLRKTGMFIFPISYPIVPASSWDWGTTSLSKCCQWTRNG